MFYMRQQRTFRYRPQVMGYIIVRFCHPVVQRAPRIGLHDAGNFLFAPQTMGFEVRDNALCMVQNIPMCRQNLREAVFSAQLSQQV